MQIKWIFFQIIYTYAIGSIVSGRRRVVGFWSTSSGWRLGCIRTFLLVLVPWHFLLASQAHAASHWFIWWLLTDASGGSSTVCSCWSLLYHNKCIWIIQMHYDVYVTSVKIIVTYSLTWLPDLEYYIASQYDTLEHIPHQWDKWPFDYLGDFHSHSG